MNLLHDIRSDSPVPPQYEGEQPLSRLQYERERRGWSQLKLAEKVCTTVVSVNRWENGHVFPRPFYRRQLSEALEIGLGELFPEGSRRSHTNQAHDIASIVPIQTNGLRHAREHLGLSQDELAKALGTTRGTVTRWESGQCFPKPRYRQKLSELLGISLEELFPNNITKPGSPIEEEDKETGTHIPAFHSSGQHLFDY